MNKKLLIVGIFYVLFSVIFFLLTFGRFDDICLQIKDTTYNVPDFEYTHLLEKGAGFVCALRYVFIAISLIALTVGVLCIVKSSKKSSKIVSDKNKL